MSNDSKKSFCIKSGKVPKRPPRRRPPTHEDVFIGRTHIGSYEYETGKITFNKEFLSAISAQLSDYETEKGLTE